MMVPASPPSLRFLIDQTLAEVPALATAVSNDLQDELKSRLEHQHLLDGWNRQRLRFAADLDSALTQSLMAALDDAATPRRAHSPHPGSELSLSLVDDAQALRDVAIAHVSSSIEDLSRAELHLLDNYFSALRGIARPLKSDNPLRAATFAQALAQAIEDVPLDADGRYALTRIAAPSLAGALQRLYASLCQSLRAAQLSEMLIHHHSTSGQSERHQRQWGHVPDRPMPQGSPSSLTAPPRSTLTPGAAAESASRAAVSPGPGATGAMPTSCTSRSTDGTQTLERRRQAWLRELRSQLRHRIEDAQAGKVIRDFLLGPWIEVVDRVVARHGAQASETRACLGVVSTLLHSLSPQPDAAARERLRAQLPDLIDALNRGMDVIALPPADRQNFLEALMRRHGRALQLPGCVTPR